MSKEQPSIEKRAQTVFIGSLIGLLCGAGLIIEPLVLFQSTKILKIAAATGVPPENVKMARYARAIALGVLLFQIAFILFFLFYK